MQNLKIHFLNTIWSDAIILESNNHYAFIDTGSSFYYPMIEKHLKNYNINKIDFILLTHFHSDHYGNIEKLINDYQVDKLYLKHYYGLDGSTASGFQSNEEYIENEFKNYNNIINSSKANNTQIIYVDDLNDDILKIQLSDVTIKVYDINNRLYQLYSDPSCEFYHQKKFNENFNSMGVFLKVNNHNIFLGADVTCSKTNIKELQILSIMMLEKIYANHNINHINLYKSCHHGGGGTNTKELCDLLKANIVIITNTAKWLDTYDTYSNLKNANKDVIILPTDYQKYIFDIEDKISYQIIKEDSLFITLNKK